MSLVLMIKGPSNLLLNTLELDPEELFLLICLSLLEELKDQLSRPVSKFSDNSHTSPFIMFYPMISCIFPQTNQHFNFQSTPFQLSVRTVHMSTKLIQCLLSQHTLVLNLQSLLGSQILLCLDTLLMIFQSVC